MIHFRFFNTLLFLEPIRLSLSHFICSWFWYWPWDVPLTGYASLLLRWDSETSPGQMGQTVKSLQHSGSPPTWMCLEGFQREVSSLVHTPTLQLMPTIYYPPSLHPLFHHAVAKTRGRAIYLRHGQVSNNKNIKKKKSARLRFFFFCLSLLKERTI